MKSTGMTRRIDELGRVVIPKEIRRTLRLNVGEEVEIYVDEETLLLKKHSSLASRQATAKRCAEALKRAVGGSVLINDLSRILAAASADDVEGKEITDEYLNVLNKRETLLTENSPIPIYYGDKTQARSLLIAPIISKGDLIGGIACVNTKRLYGEGDRGVLKVTTEILASELGL